MFEITGFGETGRASDFAEIVVANFERDRAEAFLIFANLGGEAICDAVEFGKEKDFIGGVFGEGCLLAVAFGFGWDGHHGAVIDAIGKSEELCSVVSSEQGE